jgi:hypothetical protein
MVDAALNDFPLKLQGCARASCAVAVDRAPHPFGGRRHGDVTDTERRERDSPPYFARPGRGCIKDLIGDLVTSRTSIVS